MPDMTIKEAFILGMRAQANATAKGADPGYVLALGSGSADELLAEPAADHGAKLYEMTPERFRIDPGTVAARERRRVEDDHRIVEQARTATRSNGSNAYDAIRESVRAAEEETKKRTERMRTLFERGGS